jgi:hypothetical protein
MVLRGFPPLLVTRRSNPGSFCDNFFSGLFGGGGVSRDASPFEAALPPRCVSISSGFAPQSSHQKAMPMARPRPSAGRCWKYVTSGAKLTEKQRFEFAEVWCPGECRFRWRFS